MRLKFHRRVLMAAAGLVSLATCLPAAAQQKNKKNDDENRGEVHVRLLCALGQYCARASTVRAEVAPKQDRVRNYLPRNVSFIPPMVF